MSLTLTLERGGGEVSGSGTNIELNHTIAGGAIESVEMYGDTEQTTYSGKNLVNAPETFTFNRNYLNFQQFSAGTYYVSCGNVTKGGANDPQIGDSSSHIAMTSNMLNQILNFTGNALTVYSNGWSWGESSVNSTVEKLIITTSPISSIADYEPYVGGTASPNPDYPQEVQTVTGRQVVTITDGDSQSQEYEINLGKNLFDKDNFPSVDGFIRADNYTLTSSSSNKTTYIQVSPNTTYTFSGFSLGVALVVGTFNKVPALGDVANVRILKGASDTTVTITTGTSDSYIAFMYKTSSDTLDTSAFQIEKGSTATTYAPYFTPIELCKIGTYQDYIYKSGEDWYVHKNIGNAVFNGSEAWGAASTSPNMYYLANAVSPAVVEYPSGFSDYFTVVTRYPNQHLGELAIRGANKTDLMIRYDSMADVTALTTWFGTHNTSLYYPLATPTDTQITNSALIAQLNALNAGDTYDGTTVITVASENLAGPLEVTVSSNITKTYTEVEIGSPFTITDVEGKSSNTTLDGNVYVDWAYNKKQYSFDLFNLTPQDYADIRAFYDYQFNNSAFPTITVPELNIDKLPVYMEISSRNIINQCLLTDKLTIKFRETVQP